MRRLIVIAVAVAFTGCAAEVIGPYAKLVTHEDLRQIQAIASARIDIYHKCVAYVHATRPDCVYVEATQALGGPLNTTFTACKRDGKWIVIERSIKNYNGVILTE